MEPAITEVTNRENIEQRVSDIKGQGSTSAKKSTTKSTEKTTQPTENLETRDENLERTEETRKEGDETKERLPEEANTAIEEERRTEEKETKPEDTNLGKRPASKEILEPTDKEDQVEPALEKKVKGESVSKGVRDEEQPRETTASEGQ